MGLVAAATARLVARGGFVQYSKRILKVRITARMRLRHQPHHQGTVSALQPGIVNLIVDVRP